jgi:fructose-1,6-bisphosphatase/inositol monophosphatase family enzyme
VPLPVGLGDAVADLVREVSAEVIEPRFRLLTEGETRLKEPGEPVTVADEEAEALLTRRLGELLPGVPVVGEEACAADPALRAMLAGERAWLVDPLDGTANFIAGRPDWAVMVALVEYGETLVPDRRAALPRRAGIRGHRRWGTADRPVRS